MEENEIIETVEIRPVKHDGWSVLIIGLNWAAHVAEASTSALDQFTMMAAQHANHKRCDKEFDKIAEGFHG